MTHNKNPNDQNNYKSPNPSQNASRDASDSSERPQGSNASGRGSDQPDTGSSKDGKARQVPQDGMKSSSKDSHSGSSSGSDRSHGEH